MNRSRYWVPVMAALVAGLVGTVAATAGTSKQTKTHASAADMAYVKKEIAKWSAIPKFTFKAPPIDTTKAAGKTFINIPISSAIPFVNTIDQAMGRVAKQYGVKMVQFPTQGQPSQWVQGIQQGINTKVDLINLQAAPNPYFLQPQLKAAKSAGIPVTVTHLFDVTQKFPPNVTALVPVDFQKAARLEADWAILDTGGKANVFIIKSAEVVPSNTIVAAMQDEFKKRCGSACKVKVVNVPITDWATKIQSEVQSALTKDPTINYVLPIYDSMSQFAAPGIVAAGKKGKVHIATFNGTPFVLKMMQDDDVVRMNVGENLDWIGYANMDQIMRVLTGMKPVKHESMPLRVFTPKNVSEAGKPPKENVGYGNAYVAGYDALWKK